jgi:hypothetical protein
MARMFGRWECGHWIWHGNNNLIRLGWIAFGAVLEAGVELNANRPWEAGGFSDASHDIDRLVDVLVGFC